MKKLDVVTISAIADTIFRMCLDDFSDEAVMLRGLLDRAGVNVRPELSRLLNQTSLSTFAVVHELNGSDDLELLLLRAASPKEHAGDRSSIKSVFCELNQALWPESLKIELDGVEPRVSEIGEQRLIHQPVSVRRQRTAPNHTANQTSTSNDVFIIHGRDIGTKDTVARFVGDLGLNPIVLQELPNGGRTIIEKFEDYAQTRFAIAIFTPDDEGSLAVESSNPKPRTRQNVIFEFGYFIGKLSRERACALIKGDVEIPSDYSGVLYISMDDADGWKVKLTSELQYAGYEVDANVLTRR